MPSRRGPALTVLIAGATLVGCGTGDGAREAPRAAVIADVEGRRFEAVSATGRRLVRRKPMLDFDEGKLDASGGCNSFFGPYTLLSGRLRQTRASTTQMGCSGGTEEQDAWIVDLLRAGMSATAIDGGRVLRLSNHDEQVILARQGD